MTEFGLLYTTRVAGAPKIEEHRLIREALEAARLAEDLGFDRFYVLETEPPGSWHTPAPEVLLGAVSMTTSRIRVAYGSACAPFIVDHPVRLAQRAATIDIISDGRLDVVFGITPSAHECARFGVSIDDVRARFPDAAQAVVKVWTQSQNEHLSDRLTLRQGIDAPALVQQPHPNLMVACTGPQSVTLAGRHGLGVVCDGGGGPDEARSRRRSYDTAITARRDDDMLGAFPYDHFTVACRACVLDDRDGARKVGVRSRPSSRLSPDRFGLHRAHAAYGSAEDAIEVAERMVEAGVDEILFVCDRGEISREATIETMRNLGERVIPHFRRAPMTASASQPLAG
ncbi:MAG: Alkanal monooxygenase alpha chain [Solirubrobacterales bacterium]|nr:Alkanal monooxygenase alpha chain [Solirubrobacterales bacterium]